MRSVVVHGHFYQPPRENPWSDVVEPDPGAAPFTDWNTRITHECYLPFATARELDASGRVTARTNLFEWTSFDAGPTLLRWLDTHAPDVHAAIVHADRESARRLSGHGNAVAMPYHHVIFPLASRRDKVTEVRWGLADFRRRFGRNAEGMWLPETAVDEDTLVVLAEEGLRFTILAPHQVDDPPENGAPLRFAAGGGRELALFAYDGALSHGVAFGELLEDGDVLAEHLSGTAPGLPRPARRGALSLKSIATDGETFGHHRTFTEMALARAIGRLRQDPRVRVENFASVLARLPARVNARLVEDTAWSCPHGIERWRSNCGCRATPGTSQEWRRPLRAALNWLARELDARYTQEGAAYFSDEPWRVRDAFGTVAALPLDARREFVRTQLLPGADTGRALRLLECMGARLGMFGSCAWFFDDVAGHEAQLMLRLAAYALDKIHDNALEKEFIERLAFARSNDPAEGDGARAYRAHALSMRAAAVT